MMETTVAAIVIGHLEKDSAAISCGAESFFQKATFFFLRQNQKLLGSVSPFSQISKCSFHHPLLQELSRFSNQQFKDHHFRSCSTPMRHKGNKIEK